MTKKQKTEWEFIEVAQHFCYICHERFFLMCGTPQVKIGGCCFGLDYKGQRFVLPLYAHLDCYMSREVKRKQSIIPDEIFRGMVKQYCKQELKGIVEYLKVVKANPKWKANTDEERKKVDKYERWIIEVSD